MGEAHPPLSTGLTATVPYAELVNAEFARIDRFLAATHSVYARAVETGDADVIAMVGGLLVEYTWWIVRAGRATRS